MAIGLVCWVMRSCDCSMFLVPLSLRNLRIFNPLWRESSVRFFIVILLSWINTSCPPCSSPHCPPFRKGVYALISHHISYFATMNEKMFARTNIWDEKCFTFHDPFTFWTPHSRTGFVRSSCSNNQRRVLSTKLNRSYLNPEKIDMSSLLKFE